MLLQIAIPEKNKIAQHVPTGDPGNFYQKFIEIFVTLKAKEIITEGPGVGGTPGSLNGAKRRKVEDREAVFVPLTPFGVFQFLTFFCNRIF
jgi:hypothetical protein